MEKQIDLRPAKNYYRNVGIAVAIFLLILVIIPLFSRIIRTS